MMYSTATCIIGWQLLRAHPHFYWVRIPPRVRVTHRFDSCKPAAPGPALFATLPVRQSPPWKQAKSIALVRPIYSR